MNAKQLTVGFEILASVLGTRQIEPCRRVCLTDQGLLCLVAGHRYAGSSAILINTSLSDNAFDVVAVAQCLT